MIKCSIFVMSLLSWWIYYLSNTKVERLVNIEQGPVIGYKDPLTNTFDFHGIPYATAPTGPDKFKAPLPPPSWHEPFEAIERDIVCPQNRTTRISDKKNIQEDCLIANVFVPDTNEPNLPVVVYIYGGAFEHGFGNQLTPKHLVKSQRIIIVTFNYRLGAQGFLCLGTPDIPGNAALRDQVALLRWVKRNIANFGGNPNDVTLAGYSAGSITADLMILSKMTDGLFKRVILESGSNIATCSVQLDPIANAKKFAQFFNFTDVDDICALEHFYKTASHEILTSRLVDMGHDRVHFFTPCVEKDVGQEIFLHNSPWNILKSGNFKKLPILCGITEMEGIYQTVYFTDWVDKMNENFADFLPNDLRFPNYSIKSEIGKKAQEYYFGKESVSLDTIFNFINYFTDILFAYPAMRSLNMQLEAGNNEIYFYEFSYVDMSIFIIPNTNNSRGAAHCTQTHAVLDGIYNGSDSEEFLICDDYKLFKAKIREFWLNFMTTGKPVPEGSNLTYWPPVGPSLPYMSFNKTIELRQSLWSHRAKFWDDIYKEYYSPPIPPQPAYGGCTKNPN